MPSTKTITSTGQSQDTIRPTAEQNEDSSNKTKSGVNSSAAFGSTDTVTASQVQNGPDLDDILADLTSTGDWEVDEEHAAHYQRTVQFELSDEASALYGPKTIEVSCRQILTWIADSGELQDFDLTALRDDFYSGDDQSDDCLFADELNRFSPSRQQIANIKLRRSMTKIDRDDERKAIEEQDLKAAAREEAIWAPHAAEKAELEQKRRELVAESDQIVDDWLAHAIRRTKGVSSEDQVEFADLGAELIEREQFHDRKWQINCKARMRLSEKAILGFQPA